MAKKNILDKKTGKTSKKKITKTNNSKKGKTKKKTPKKASTRKKVKSAKSKKKGKQHKEIPKWIQLLAVIFGLCISLVIGKIFFLDISREQAKRIQIAQEEVAGEDGILEEQMNTEKVVGRPKIQQAFLTVNEYSRSGIEIGDVKNIVVHYVSNPGSSAMDNRNYFEGLKDNHARKASSHYVIGVEGEIVQCIPLNEISYASNNRNSDSISIECCHDNKDGKFNDATYDSLIRLLSWLCDTYGLSEKDIIRHYDITGKMCPLYYVEHEEEWEGLKIDVRHSLP